MTMTYKTITGQITLPGSNVGVRAKVTATPLTTNAALTYTDDDRITVGAVTVETSSAGNLPTFQIPTNVDIGELYWRITAELLNPIPGAPKKWTVKSATQITGSGTTKLKDLLEVDTIAVDAQILVNLSDLVTEAEDARDDAESAELGATTAKTAAETAQAAAAGSATAAAGSASSASTSAGTATTKAGEAAASATAADASADAAAADRSAVEDLVGAAEAVAVTNDTIMASRAADPESAFSGVLSASFVGGETRAGAGAYTTGNVMLMGGHAYAPGGIATAAVFGGALNYENVIGGNLSNVNTSTSNLTGAPTLIAPNGNWNFLLGGYDTVVNGWSCFVIGNHIKVATDVNHATIAGGSLHVINTNGNYAAVGGGTGHTVNNEYCTVGGGRLHTIGGTLGYSTIGGGYLNSSTNEYTTVGGGKSNTASEANATVAGGNANTASANSSSVGGGLTNTASGIGANVPGGRDNVASGDYSTALGRYGSATNTYGVAVGQGGLAARVAELAVGNRFATSGDAQASLIVMKTTTTNATGTLLSDGATAAPQMTALSTVAFKGLVVARRTDTEGDHAAFRIEGCMARHASGTVLVGTPTISTVGATTNATTWSVAVGASSGRLNITVTGEASKTIRWVCRLETVQVTP